MIGGGQLARMTHQSAIALGQTLRVLAVTPDDPAAQVTPDVVIGSHTDLDALRRAAEGAAGVDLRPRTRADRAAREAGRRGRQRGTAARGADPRPGQVGDAAGGWRRIGAPDSALRRGDRHRRGGGVRRTAEPVVLKTARGGYDGRGVLLARDLAEARDFAAAISPRASRFWSRNGWRCGASWPRWWPGRRSARAPHGRWWRPCSATASASR